MGELINITTDGQGLSVVSARELYAFLGVKQQFTDWLKNRINRYGFREGEDYTTVSKISETAQAAGSGQQDNGTPQADHPVEGGNSSEKTEPPPHTESQGGFHKVMKNPATGSFHNSIKDNRGGRPQLDYALSLDMAKELSMVENMKRGKQARRYFINAEKMLRQVAQSTVTTEQVMLQQAHALLSQQRQIDQLRSEVTQIMAGQRPTRRNRRSAIAAAPTLPGLGLPALSAPHQRPPARNVRSEINQTIDAYCNRFNVSHSETWKYLYRRLQDVYRINVHRLVRIGQERTIDTLERYGHLDTLAKLIQAELVNRESS